MDGGREINSIPLNWGLKWGWAGGSEIERNGGNQPLLPILVSPSPCNQFYCMCWTSCICPLEPLSSLFHGAPRPGRPATVDQIHKLINLELLIMSANGEAQGEEGAAGLLPERLPQAACVPCQVTAPLKVACWALPSPAGFQGQFPSSPLHCVYHLSFFFNFLFYIGAELINNVVLVSGVQQSDSVLHIHVSIYSSSNSFPI